MDGDDYAYRYANLGSTASALDRPRPVQWGSDECHRHHHCGRCPQCGRRADRDGGAKARFARGKQLFDEKDYAGALVEFQPAYAVVPSPVTEPAPPNGKRQADGRVSFRGPLPPVPTLLLSGDQDLSTPLA